MGFRIDHDQSGLHKIEYCLQIIFIFPLYLICLFPVGDFNKGFHKNFFGSDYRWDNGLDNGNLCSIPGNEDPF